MMRTNTNAALDGFVAQCCAVDSRLDPVLLKKCCIAHLRAHDKRAFVVSDLQPIVDMTEQWETGLELEALAPAYEVYNNPYYFAELWLCWQRYSKRTLKEMVLPKMQDGTSMIDRVTRMGKIHSVLDLGCGMGYTTAVLRKLFPNAIVHGTNVCPSKQFEFADRLSIHHDFKVMTNDYAMPQTYDLVFASEYFEHIYDPISHLKHVLTKTLPRYVICANTFGPMAIGHFDYYMHEHQRRPAKEMSRHFKNLMEEYGYTKEKTKCWNGRPSLYVARGC